MERLRFTTPEWLFYEHIVGDTRAPMAKLASRSDQGGPAVGCMLSPPGHHALTLAVTKACWHLVAFWTLQDIMDM